MTSVETIIAHRPFLRNHQNHKWSGPQGWSSVNDWGPGEKWLEVIGFGKTCSGSSEALQKRLSGQYFAAAVDNTDCYILDRSAHCCFGQCPWRRTANMVSCWNFRTKRGNEDRTWDRSAARNSRIVDLMSWNSEYLSSLACSNIFSHFLFLFAKSLHKLFNSLTRLG